MEIEVNFNLPADRVIRTLESVVVWRGYPVKLRMDNGPEFFSSKLATRVEENNVELEFINPGKLTQNSFVERFNRTFRDEILDFYVFYRLSEVREFTDN